LLINSARIAARNARSFFHLAPDIAFRDALIRPTKTRYSQPTRYSGGASGDSDVLLKPGLLQDIVPATLALPPWRQKQVSTRMVVVLPTVRPQEPHDLTSCDLETDVVHGRGAAVAFRQTFNFDHEVLDPC
jgi:hypothetical protein